MKETEMKIRKCGTMEVYNRQVENFPEFRRAQATIENDILNLLERKTISQITKPVKIHVVVHIVYNNENENISESQVISQIAVLNQDYSATNADLPKVPEVWSELVADPMISFELAEVGPDGIPGNGITRTQTSNTSFGTDDSVKFDDQGGKSAWPTEKYLNIWVCTIGGGILGYAQFPGGPAETDGVVIDFQCFGTEGTAVDPFNLGRTATHEVGHYLNLSHTFGEGRGNTCSDSDYVEDTPNQLAPNYQKPVFPKVSCNNGPNGDMFMNYMDYVDDDTMFMFTIGQKERMQATLLGPRASLIAGQLNENSNV
ncbi:MAG: zinc metalloprotease [Pedobacter sp.]